MSCRNRVLSEIIDLEVKANLSGVLAYNSPQLTRRVFISLLDIFFEKSRTNMQHTRSIRGRRLWTGFIAGYRASGASEPLIDFFRLHSTPGSLFASYKKSYISRSEIKKIKIKLSFSLNFTGQSAAWTSGWGWRGYGSRTLTSHHKSPNNHVPCAWWATERSGARDTQLNSTWCPCFQFRDSLL